MSNTTTIKEGDIVTIGASLNTYVVLDRFDDGLCILRDIGTDGKSRLVRHEDTLIIFGDMRYPEEKGGDVISVKDIVVQDNSRKAHDDSEFYTKAGIIRDIRQTHQMVDRQPRQEIVVAVDFGRTLEVITLDEFKERFTYKSSTEDLIPEAFDVRYYDYLFNARRVSSNLMDVFLTDWKTKEYRYGRSIGFHQLKQVIDLNRGPWYGRTEFLLDGEIIATFFQVGDLMRLFSVD